MIAVGYLLRNGLRDDDPHPTRIGPVGWVRGRFRFPAEWAMVDCPTSGCGDGWSTPDDCHDWTPTPLPIGGWLRGQSGQSVTCDRCGWSGMVTRAPVTVRWWYDAAVRKLFGSVDPWAPPPASWSGRVRHRVGLRLIRDYPPF